MRPDKPFDGQGSQIFQGLGIKDAVFAEVTASASPKGRGATAKNTVRTVPAPAPERRCAVEARQRTG